MEAKDLNRGAMVFDSQGCKPLVGVPGTTVNGGAVALCVLVIGYMRWSIAIRDAPGESMPSLRDSRFVVGCIPGGLHSRGLHPWLSNDTAPPLNRNTAPPLNPTRLRR